MYECVLCSSHTHTHRFAMLYIFFRLYLVVWGATRTRKSGCWYSAIGVAILTMSAICHHCVSPPLSSFIRMSQQCVFDDDAVVSCWLPLLRLANTDDPGSGEMASQKKINMPAIEPNEGKEGMCESVFGYSLKNRYDGQHFLNMVCRIQLDGVT